MTCMYGCFVAMLWHKVENIIALGLKQPSPTLHLVTLGLASRIPQSEEALVSKVKGSFYITVYINTALR